MFLLTYLLTYNTKPILYCELQC